MDDLKSKVEKHRFHIKKLETILRMLDNMSVEVDQVHWRSMDFCIILAMAYYFTLCTLQVKKIKDDIEYYIESSQDSDFQENEYLYDDIEGIDDVELTGLAVAGSANTDSNGTPTSMTSSPVHTSPLLQQPILQPSVNNSSETGILTATTEEKKKEKLSQSTPVSTTCINNISSMVR